MDELRVLVIAGVIVVHTATAYVADVAGWYYDDERVASGFWSTLVTVPALLAAVFALGPLFVVAGWYAARSMARRGPAGFARSRLLRLGVPTVAFVLVLQPLADFIGNIHDERASFGHYLARTEVSVMWFAVALLAFSLVYALLGGRRPAPMAPAPLPAGLLAGAALVIGTTSFVVWLVWPLDDEMWFNLRVPAWPQGAVLFAVGVHAAHHGWLADLPRSCRRAAGWAVVVATAALVGVVAVATPGGDDEIVMGADLPTLVFAMLDGVIAVAFALWLLARLQGRPSLPSPRVAVAARASFATYVVHPLVLTTVMVALAAVPLGPVAKFVLVSVVGVPACFAVGYGLTRVPGVSRIV